VTDEERIEDDSPTGAIAAGASAGSDPLPLEAPTEISEPGEPAQTGELAGGATGEDAEAAAAAREASAQAKRTAAEAEAAEAREQLAHADTRRAEEAEVEAEEERKTAEQHEQELERKQAAARQREEQAADEARRAREQAESAAEQARDAGERAPQGAAPLSAGSLTSPGVGLDPGAAAVASARDAATYSSVGGSAATANDPFADLPFGDRPEIQAGIAFGATFVLAKVLKSIAS